MGSMTTMLQRTGSGVTFCAAVGLGTVLLGTAAPGLSPLLIAIILGAILRNLIQLPESWEPGIQFAAKRILRWGVVLLGLQISLKTVLDLGPQVRSEERRVGNEGRTRWSEDVHEGAKRVKREVVQCSK